MVVDVVSFYYHLLFYRNKINNEHVDTDVFQSSSLMTAWEEIFLMPRVEENRQTLVNGYTVV